MSECNPTRPAPPGESEIGDVPFAEGAESFVEKLTEALGKGVGAVLGVFLAVFTFLLTPLEWLVAAASLVAKVMAIGVQTFFIPAAGITGPSNTLVSPVLLACIFIALTIRIIAFPMILRSNTHAVKMQLVQPQISALRRKYRNDREALSQELMKLQKMANFNPLGQFMAIPVVVLLAAGVWQLIKGLTIRSREGTFAPRYVSPDSALSNHLESVRNLTSFDMNLAHVIPQVGVCASTIPYLVTLAILALLTVLSVQSVWQQGHRYIAAGLVISTIISYALLPAFFLVIRVVDNTWTVLQSRYLIRRRQGLVLRLRSDPDFLA